MSWVPAETGLPPDDKGKAGFPGERRLRMRRFTVRRRHERSGSERRMSERRQSVNRLAFAEEWAFSGTPSWSGGQLPGGIGILAR